MTQKQKSSAAPAAAVRVTAILAVCLTLAACGRQEEDQLFLRETEGRTQLPPAPDIEDLPPTPAFGADRIALLEACMEQEDAAEESCECLADTAARELGRNAYAYFLAQARGRGAEAARLEAGLSVDEVAEIARTASSIAITCGVRSAE